MIQNQDLTSVFVIILILVFYFFQVFQRVKLLYLFRSTYYHFANIFFPYNSDDLIIHERINYFNFFYVFFFHLIMGITIAYLGAFIYLGEIKSDGMNAELFESLLFFNFICYIIILTRFFIINYLLDIFLNSKIKFLFFKNFIINIIIGLLLFINYAIYNLNDFYTIDYLKNTFFIIIGLHFIFQAKNYLSYFIKLDPKEIMYFILYLCAFKLAPLLWLYSILDLT